MSRIRLKVVGERQQRVRTRSDQPFAAAGTRGWPADNPVVRVDVIQAFVTNSMDFGRYDWKGTQLETLMKAANALGEVKVDGPLKNLDFKDKSAWGHSEKSTLTHQHFTSDTISPKLT